MEQVENEHLKVSVYWFAQDASDESHSMVERLSKLDHVHLGVVKTSPGKMNFIASYNPLHISQPLLEAFIREALPSDKTFVAFNGYHSSSSSSSSLLQGES